MEILYLRMCSRVLVLVYITFMCIWRSKDNLKYHPKEHHLPPISHGLSFWCSTIRLDQLAIKPQSISPVCYCTWFLYGEGHQTQVLVLARLDHWRQKEILRPLLNILDSSQNNSTTYMEFMIQDISNDTEMRGRWPGRRWEVSYHPQITLPPGSSGE